MANQKQDFYIKPIGEADYRCLPLWIAQDIILKIQTNLINNVDILPTDELEISTSTKPIDEKVSEAENP